MISSRLLNYLNEIHSREDHELLKRVFKKQKVNPVKGDCTHLVNKDMENTDLQEQNIIHIDKASVTKEIINEIKHAAFTCLKMKQHTHKTIKHIQYNKLETQDYLKTPTISNKEAEMKTALRSQTVKAPVFGLVS